MAYAGYNVKIDSVIIPNDIIEVGTYSHIPEKRIRSERKDANGITHFKYYPTLKHKISFTIQARTKTQHDSIKAALTSRNGVTVKFWDEDSEDYLTGTFDMTAPVWQHSFENTATFYYAPTQIELIQH